MYKIIRQILINSKKEFLEYAELVIDLFTENDSIKDIPFIEHFYKIKHISDVIKKIE